METGAGAIWSQCTACPKPDQRWYGIRIGCSMAYKLFEQDANFIELTVENNEGSDGGNDAIDCCEMRGGIMGVMHICIMVTCIVKVRI